MQTKKPGQSDKERPDFTEECIASEPVHSGRVIKVSVDRVRLPNGEEATREVARHPGAAVILPLLDNETVLLEWQYRYPLGRHILEIPAGKLDNNEDPRIAAERELLEETGYRANKWTFMMTMIPSPGFCDEAATLFLAEDLHYEGHQGEDDEFVSVEKTPIKTALQWINDGTIIDAKTIIALMWLKQQRNI